NGVVISVGTFGSGQGGDVMIAAGNVHLDASTLITRASGPGRSGDVHITADSLTLENRSRITTATSGLGLLGGDLFLNVGTLKLLRGPRGESLIRSTNTTGIDLDDDGLVDVTGVGGNVTVQGTKGAGSAADSVVLLGGSGITSDASAGSGGG